jgi:uncharacterized protein (TIGR02996 family)
MVRPLREWTVGDEEFLGAIAAAPADDAPRLAYADWLEERGDPRAAFLRAEVAFTRLGPTADGRARLLKQRAEVDPGWWPRLARAAGAPVAFRCAACGLTLTGPLWPLADAAWVGEADGTPLVPAGYFMQSDGTLRAGMAGHYCVNLADLRNTGPHPDSRRHNGCCGADGCDGPNTVCGNGHEVGTECSDCWMPHFVHLDPAFVLLVVAGVPAEPGAAADRAGGRR